MLRFLRGNSVAYSRFLGCRSGRWREVIILAMGSTVRKTPLSHHFLQDSVDPFKCLLQVFTHL
jgi:hypothetical protein